MNTTTESQRINGDSKQILILEQNDYSALSALLYDLSHEPRLREIARQHGLALGANHIESIAGLWAKLN